MVTQAFGSAGMGDGGEGGGGGGITEITVLRHNKREVEPRHAMNNYIV
jgi:hypothetical protein